MGLFTRKKAEAQKDGPRFTSAGLQIVDFPAHIRQLVRLDTGLGSSYANMYAHQPNIRPVVDTIAREAAELSLKMYERVPRSDLLPAGRLDISGDHPMMDLLSDPTPGVSTYDFWFGTYADKCVYDKVIWRKVYSPQEALRRGQLPTAPVALVRIPPEVLTEVRNPVTNELVGMRQPNGKFIPMRELVIHWGYDPATRQGALSPMESMRRLLADAWLRDQFQSEAWKNSLRKDGVIEQDLEAKEMSDEEAESYLLDLEDQHAGARGSARPMLLLPGHKWQDVSWSPKDAEYIASRKLSRVEVCAHFHMPPSMVSAGEAEPDDKTLSFFYKSTLPPFLSWLERSIEATLLPDFEPSRTSRRTKYVEFNMDGKLRGAFEERAAIMATAAGGPVVTLNEARARLNLPPIIGGDQVIVPLNVMLGGGPQVAPTAPTTTPAEGLQPAGVTPSPQLAEGTRFATPDELAELLPAFDEHAAQKAAEAASREWLAEQRVRYEERGRLELARILQQQRRVVEDGKTFTPGRWNDRLADVLFQHAYQAVGVVGEATAEQLKGAFDHERTANFIRANCEQAAQAINDLTADRLSAGDEPNLDAVFGEPRAEHLALDRTTWAFSWAQGEVIHQNEG